MTAPSDLDAAAQLLRNAGWTLEPPTGAVKHGCFWDLFAMPVGTEPDGCVMDEGRHQDCMYASPNGDKWKCKEWKAWTPESLATSWKEFSND